MMSLENLSFRTGRKIQSMKMLDDKWMMNNILQNWRPQVHFNKSVFPYSFSLFPSKPIMFRNSLDFFFFCKKINLPKYDNVSLKGPLHPEKSEFLLTDLTFWSFHLQFSLLENLSFFEKIQKLEMTLWVLVSSHIFIPLLHTAAKRGFEILLLLLNSFRNS